MTKTSGSTIVIFILSLLILITLFCNAPKINLFKKSTIVQVTNTESIDTKIFNVKYKAIKDLLQPYIVEHGFNYTITNDSQFVGTYIKSHTMEYTWGDYFKNDYTCLTVESTDNDHTWHIDKIILLRDGYYYDIDKSSIYKSKMNTDTSKLIEQLRSLEKGSNNDSN